MWHSYWTAALLAGLATSSASSASSASSSPDIRQIAVIGAGAAGASTAFHLQRFAAASNITLNVTLFEKTSRIGGRTLTVDVFDDPHQPVELGASIFVQVNEIIWSAIDEFNLPRIPAGSADGDDAAESDSIFGIWDGDKFVYTEDDASSDWWNLARLFWTYGTAPYRANKLMRGTITKFLQLYKAPYFPFRSLTTRAHELELAAITSQTGAAFLEASGISYAFAHDLVQASTRVNYASNLAGIHGLDTMVALAPQGASQIKGGNWQVFDAMVQAAADSGHVHWLGNTTVTGIARADGTAPPASRYVVSTSDESLATLDFDNVVLAGPQQFSGIKTGAGVLQTPIVPIDYVQLHVTLFTTPLKLSAQYFGLAPGSKVPTTVLTTLAEDDDPNGSSGLDGTGKAGFFSVSALRRVVNPDTLREEYVYKIFSPDKVTASLLSKLFAVGIPETGLDNNDTGADAGQRSLSPISWFYPHVFYSYPKAVPRTTFQDPVVGDGVYYTSGIESFISTMETSALMGKNVARLIVDDIQGLSTGHAVHKAANEEL
ncbi:prenylcysteine oxidase [Ophiostoma piceae UAMH 11346]|uniref:Prenylcysteine oxidase n=1 Tax=Ophiostoma piceae (strain UAMH 11346) TaxID=1262450 RepID=S3CWL3_OPHP1|nr:prenylcysteine oxidase [Ophiostoma piceae UAMH 11346]